MQRERTKDGVTLLRGGDPRSDFNHRTFNTWNASYNFTSTVMAASGNALIFPVRDAADRFRVSYDVSVAPTTGTLTVLTRLFKDGVAYGPQKYGTHVINSWIPFSLTQTITGLTPGDHYVQIGLQLFSAGTILVAGLESIIDISRLP